MQRVKGYSHANASKRLMIPMLLYYVRDTHHTPPPINKRFVFRYV
jgi:hypothetical protein